MLAIETREENPCEVVLTLRGELADQAARRFEDECLRWVAKGYRVLVELGGVTDIDQRAFALLRAFSGNAVAAHHSSGMVTELLGHHSCSSCPGA